MGFLFSSHFTIATTVGLERVSNIFDNAGQVALGAGVFSPVFSGFDKINIGVVVLGVSIVSLCWTLSIWLARRKDEEI